MSVRRVTVPTRQVLEGRLRQHFSERSGFALATLNLDHLVKLRTDAAFQRAYDQHDLITADGNPVVWLERLAGSRAELLPGSDMVLPLLRMAAEHGVGVGFVGSTAEVLARAADAVKADVPGLDVRVTIAPPFGFDPEGQEAARILDELSRADVGLCLIALGAPKQERFAAFGRHRAPKVGFASIGASLDFLAGRQKRAPLWVRRIAMEWLWRAALSPRRLGGRYARCLVLFPGMALSALSERGPRRA
jgi:exopolysaccharide biosynthesis WecB/TagA/CpsF family protein